MTQQKSLKRRVRARMAKTGERYTAARRQVLAKTPEPPPAAEPSTPAGAPDRPADAPDQPATRTAAARGSTSDEAILARTGRARQDWFALLEAWGGADRPHPEIARWLATEHGVDGWWSQEITVDYERAIGRRKVGQHADGFSVTATKTIDAPVERLFAAFVDESIRAAWLAGVELRERTARAHRSARFDVDGGPTRLVAGFEAKGSRSLVALAHERIPDEAAAARWKAFWRERLADVQRLLQA